MIKVSIIIPIYNVEKYLEKCLKSVITQTLNDIEIICVNDKSTDESNKIVDYFSRDDNRIIVVNREKNGGLSAARNSGMKIAKGNFVSFIDSDDWIDPNYIKEMYNKAISNNVDIILNTNIVKYMPNNEDIDFFTWNNYTKKNLAGEFLDTDFSRDNTQCMTWAHLYKNDFLKKFNLEFPEGYIHEDNYFKAVTELYTDKIFAFYGSCYYYTQRENSIMNKSSVSIVNKIKIFSKIFDYYKENDFVHKFSIKNLFWLFNKQCKSEEEFIYLRELAKKLNDHLGTIKFASESHINFFFDAVLSSKNYVEYCSFQKKDIRLYILRNKIKTNLIK